MRNFVIISLILILAIIIALTVISQNRKEEQEETGKAANIEGAGCPIYPTKRISNINENAENILLQKSFTGVKAETQLAFEDVTYILPYLFTGEDSTFEEKLKGDVIKIKESISKIRNSKNEAAMIGNYKEGMKRTLSILEELDRKNADINVSQEINKINNDMEKINNNNYKQIISSNFQQLDAILDNVYTVKQAKIDKSCSQG